MFLINCTIKFEGLSYSGLTCEYLENDVEISIHIGGNPETVIKLFSYFNEDRLKDFITLTGYDENNEKQFYNMKSPKEVSLNLNASYVSLNFKK